MGYPAKRTNTTATFHIDDVASTSSGVALYINHGGAGPYLVADMSGGGNVNEKILAASGDTTDAIVVVNEAAQAGASKLYFDESAGYFVHSDAIGLTFELATLKGRVIPVAYAASPTGSEACFVLEGGTASTALQGTFSADGSVTTSTTTSRAFGSEG